MDATTLNEPAKHVENKELVAPEDQICGITLFASFGIGKSHLFYVEKGSREHVKECWKEVFKNHEGWGFDSLAEYNKPLGETVTFTLSAESCPEAQPLIEDLKMVFKTSFSAELNSKNVETTFFTAGVGILVLRLAASAQECRILFDKLQDREEMQKVRKQRKQIIDLCKKRYLRVLSEAEQHKQEVGEKLQWSLYNFKRIHRIDWEPKRFFSYPLFFVDHATYAERTKTILQQVAGSGRQRIRQSDEARVSYRGAEVYVDWSEALVNETTNSHDLIEKNFIIAFVSWFALVLMNINTSSFLFDAFVSMVPERPGPTAEIVHVRHMAYKDVADASLPIRWTTRRRDLFLLETIHRNWSSERTRQNIDERMKLLALHYQRLDDERREHFSLKIAVFGVGLTLFALVSAIADLTNLAESSDEVSHWQILGISLKKFALHLSWFLPVLILVFLMVTFWRTRVRSSAESNS